MLCAQTFFGEQVQARVAKKTLKHYCPECREAVILKRGLVKIAHFAHKATAGCEYGSGETEEHRSAKQFIYDLLLKAPANYGVSKVMLERGLGTVRPDVSCQIGDRYVAFELQRSEMSLENVQYRTAQYVSKGIDVRWVLLGARKEDRLGRHAPKVWERWIYNNNKRHLYVWAGRGFLVHDYTFTLCEIEVEETEWGGGYSYPSKRFVYLTDNGFVSLLDIT